MIWAAKTPCGKSHPGLRPLSRKDRHGLFPYTAKPDPQLITKYRLTSEQEESNPELFGVRLSRDSELNGLGESQTGNLRCPQCSVHPGPISARGYSLRGIKSNTEFARMCFPLP